jgi:hypothetical protein
MPNDPVLIIRPIHPETRPFWLDVKERIGSGTAVDVFNGAYRFVRLELYDADNPNFPPLMTDMDLLGEDQILKHLGVDQGMGGRSDYLTQLGFLPEYGAKRKTVPIPNLGWVKRYRLEVVGPAWEGFFGGDPVPDFYHTPRLDIPVFQSSITITSWSGLITSTIALEFVMPVIIMAMGGLDLYKAGKFLDFRYGHERLGYVYKGGKFIKVPWVHPPGGPNALVTLAIIALKSKSWNNAYSTFAALAYDVLQGIIELMVAPDPDLGWAPAGLRDKLSAVVRRARQRLLSELFGNQLEKFIAMSNVYLKLLILWVETIELGYASVSLMEVATVHNVIIELRRDKTIFGPVSEPIVVNPTQPFGINGRFVWHRLPVTGAGEHEAVPVVVDTSTSHLRALISLDNDDREKILLTDFVRLDETGIEPLPLVVKVRPTPGSEALTSIRLGYFQQFLDVLLVDFPNDLSPLLVADQEGEGALTVTIHNDDLREVLPPGTDPVTVRDIDLKVIRQPPQISFPDEEHYIQVGEQNALPFTVAMPHGAVFDSTQPFTAMLGTNSDDSQLRIAHLTVPFVDPWTGLVSDYTFPFVLVLTLSNDDGLVDLGPSIHARFRLPEPDIIDYYAEDFDSLGDFFDGLSMGRVSLTFELDDLDLDAPVRDFQENERPEVTVLVAPTQVEAQLIPLDDPLGQNRLVLEESVVNGALTGSILIQASALEKTIFDSDDSPMLYGSVAPHELTLSEIYQRGSNDLFHRVPFQLELTLDQPDVAAFNMEHVNGPSEGSFQYTGPLHNMIQAVGAGEATLRVRFQPLPPEDLIDIQDYSMPLDLLLTVEVPPPLEAHLDSWQDELGTEAITAGTIGRDLIHDNGTLRGRVENHRPSSAVETIKLYLSSDPGIDLIADGHLDSDGNFAVELSMQLGANDISLEATKPINEVLNGGPSLELLTLEGVQPVAEGVSDLSAPQDPGTSIRYMKRRNSVGLSAIYRRATHAEVLVSIADVVSGNVSAESIAPGLPLSYDNHEETGLTYQPAAIAGVHRIMVKADNQFDQDQDNGVTITTVPEIVDDGTAIIPLGYYKPGDPTRVGFDTTAIRFEFLVRCATHVTVQNTTTGVAPVVQPLGSSFEEVIIVEVILAVGPNLIEVRVENEFNTIPRMYEIWRRDNVYSLRNASIYAMRLSLGDEDDAPTLFDVYQDDCWGPSYSDRVFAEDDVPSPGKTYNVPDDTTTDINQLVEYCAWIIKSDINSHFVLSMSGDIIGPNYEKYTVCFLDSGQRVVSSSPYNDIVAVGSTQNYSNPPAPPQGVSPDVWYPMLANLAEGRLYRKAECHDDEKFQMRFWFAEGPAL